MAVRFVQASAALDGLVPDVPEISMAVQPALHWPKALALPVDLLAHREVTDSNSVWEPPGALSGLRVALQQPQQASATQVQRKLDVVEWAVRPRAASPQQGVLTLVEQSGGLASWQQLGRAQKKFSRVRQLEPPPAWELQQAEELLRASLRQRSQSVQRDGPAQ
jgi:hypothetical protein